jgi:hypothetical protein
MIIPGVQRAMIKRGRRRNWQEEIQDERQLAVKTWLYIVQGNEMHSVLGRQMAKAGRELRDEIIIDTFAAKATATLRARGTSMLQYLNWASVTGIPAFPLTEDRIYSYFCHARRSGVAATRLTRFRESLAFAKYTIGLDVGNEILESRRVAGAALLTMREKRPLKQRDTLPVEMVIRLERLVCNASFGIEERIVGGYMLFLLHTRCRWSDGMHVSEEPTLEDLWLEARTAHYKTSSAKGRKGKWLPLVGYASGISGLPWAANWLQVRSAAGLRAGPKRPFMPLLSTGGVWTNARMNVDDGNSAVRCILKELGLDEIDSNYGTHSMKSTPLAWFAKAGLGGDDRKLLGGHVLKSDETMIAYSRDALAGPLARLEEVYLDIRHGRFLPDSNRSGRFVTAAAEKPAKEVERPPASTSSSSSSSSSDSTSAESGDAGADRAIRQLEIMASKKTAKKKKNNLPDDCVVWRHRFRKTIHIQVGFGVVKFACGRAIDDTRFDELEALPEPAVPRCTVCLPQSLSDSDTAE